MDQTAQDTVARLQAQRLLKDLDRRARALAVLNDLPRWQGWGSTLLSPFAAGITSVVVNRLVRNSGLPESVECLLVGLGASFWVGMVVLHQHGKRLDAVVELMKLNEAAKERR